MQVLLFSHLWTKVHKFLKDVGNFLQFPAPLSNCLLCIMFHSKEIHNKLQIMENWQN